MNLILCAKKCVYQKEGYCTLEGPANLTNHESDCGYCCPPGSGAKHPEGLRNVVRPEEL